MNKQPTFLSKIKSIFTSSSIEETGLQEGETEVKRKYDDDGNLELEEYFKIYKQRSGREYIYDAFLDKSSSIFHRFISIDRQSIFYRKTKQFYYYLK